MNLLTVKNLFVRIEQKVIVEDLSFELAPRERLSVLGPNGAGKTVLLKALLNLLPYSGEIIWGPKVRIGYVPQKIDADVHLPLTFKDLFLAKCRTLRFQWANQNGRRVMKTANLSFDFGLRAGLEVKQRD